eukprot:1142016-Pelagomonas_calceolata.AAC.1
MAMNLFCSEPLYLDTVEKICHYAKITFWARAEQGGEQQQQRPPPPPRGVFQLSFHRFLKREPKDPRAAGLCALEGGSVRKRRAEEGNASTDEDSSETVRGGEVAAVMRRARRGVAALRVEG